MRCAMVICAGLHTSITRFTSGSDTTFFGSEEGMREAKDPGTPNVAVLPPPLLRFVAAAASGRPLVNHSIADCERSAGAGAPTG